MTTSFNVFAAPPATLHSVVAEIERVFGVTVTRADEEWLGACLDSARVFVCENHPYEADCGMDFPRYPIEVEFSLASPRRAGADEEAARRLFAALQAKGYPLLLTEDLDQRIDSFEPPREGPLAAPP